MILKKWLVSLTVAMTCLSATAQTPEKIIVYNAQGPTHSGTAQLLKVIEIANQQQNRYQFLVEFKTGGFESIALKSILSTPQTSVSTMSNATSEAVDRKFIDLNNYVPVFSQGDSCWAVIATVGKQSQDLSSVKSMTELTVGGPAIGGATHLAALEIGRRYNIPVRYIVFKSNFDAFSNMASRNGVTFILERIVNYQQFQGSNPDMQIVAMSCPNRHPDMPNVKTLLEYGIDTPFIWQQIVASKDMTADRRKDIEDIFSKATNTIGRKKILEISDQVPPMFNNVSTERHYIDSWQKLMKKRQQWQEEIRKHQ